MKRKLNDCDIPSATSKDIIQQDPLTFSSLGLDPRLLQAVAQEGFFTPTLIQSKAIPLALEGKDLIARARTGSGKTAAYVLPILESILRRKADHNAPKQTSALILVPTRELAQQVLKVVVAFSTFSPKDIRTINITQKASDAVTRSLLADIPDIVIATPARAYITLSTSALSLDNLTHLVIDEADLVLSYGHEEDLRLLVKSISKGVQISLISATPSTDVDVVKNLFSRNPYRLELDEAETDSASIAQYVVKCAEDEKFLLAYVIFKLKLIKGKCIIFVGDIDRCYRLKLFFEQFGIKSCVLNSELPVNSRIHVVEEFNKNVYEIIIASDEHEALGEPAEPRPSNQNFESHIHDSSKDNVDVGSDGKNLNEAEPSNLDNGLSEPATSGKDHTDPPFPQKRKPIKKNKEYGISRGIDFKRVSCVLNFDLPTSPTSYTHRIGRTARAGQTGIAFSFIIPANLYRKHKATTFPPTKHDEAILAQITQHQSRQGHELKPFTFNPTHLNAFRYRIADALRAITPLSIRNARALEIRHQLLNSAKLKRHFEENPDELRHLRLDAELRTVRIQPHLKHVPDYLMPRTGAGAVAGEEGAGAGVGKVELTGRKGQGGKGAIAGAAPHIFRTEPGNRIRKARAHKRARGSGSGNGKGNNNPLQTFRVQKARR